MEYIKNQPINISSFLEKLEAMTNFRYEVDNSNKEVSVIFYRPFTWGDGSEKISRLILHYVKGSNNIYQLTFIGSNLTQIIGYTYIHESYMWFTVKDMTQFDFEHIDDNPGILVLNVQS